MNILAHALSWFLRRMRKVGEETMLMKLKPPRGASMMISSDFLSLINVG
jgi:hypothetical protein